MMRSPESMSETQDLVREEENLSVGQDCPALAGELAGPGWLRDMDPLGVGQR